MRASAAFQITIDRFGFWRAGVGTLLVVVGAALIAWYVSRDGFTPIGLRAGVGFAGGLLLVAAAGLLRCPSMSLRWDTQCWRLGRAENRGDEPWTGHLAVALDLGSWMLLKFIHDPDTGRRGAHWLPVQRRGLEAQWHALRCAVYSARPARGHDAGLDPASRPESQQ
jgi:hypothetical protein